MPRKETKQPRSAIPNAKSQEDDMDAIRAAIDAQAKALDGKGDLFRTATVDSDALLESRDASADLRLSDRFFSTLFAYVQEVSLSYPECSKTAVRLKQLSMASAIPAMQEKIMAAYANTMKPFYDLVDSVVATDDAPLRAERIRPMLNYAPDSFFASLDFAEKWAEIVDDVPSQNAHLEYICELNKIARLHAALPKGIMRKLEGIATVLSGAGGNPSAQNPHEIAMDLLNKATDEDRAHMIDNLGDLVGWIQDEDIQSQATASGMRLPSAATLRMLVSEMKQYPDLRDTLAGKPPAKPEEPEPHAFAKKDARKRF